VKFKRVFLINLNIRRQSVVFTAVYGLKLSDSSRLLSNWF